MFLEPFGLLAVLPFPEWLKQFIPAYKATRIIAEVVIESLPQCFLQSYIYLAVVYKSRDGTASESELAMLEYTAVLPTSILISTVWHYTQGSQKSLLFTPCPHSTPALKSCFSLYALPHMYVRPTGGNAQDVD